jgi:hypothetical protein
MNEGMIVCVNEWMAFKSTLYIQSSLGPKVMRHHETTGWDVIDKTNLVYC